MSSSFLFTVALGMAFTVLASVPGSAQSPAAPAQSESRIALAPNAAAKARHSIVEWLECEECEDGELERVVELGAVATPTLAATLRQGPSEASRELVRRELANTYEQLAAYAADHPGTELPMDREQYISTYLDNYIALYQIRSAKALAAIGGDAAKRALEEGEMISARSDVREAIRQLRNSID
jgi:hypothetical protein